MSGVAGVISFDGAAVGREPIQRMLAAAPQRGGSDSPTWVGKGAALAYQVTLDSSAPDGQGLARAGRLVCVADARIDNRDELVAVLGSDAPQPVMGDAQLVLAAYGRWGPECAARIVGDFAFAVWDARRRKLFAARDPMAMRPLAWYHRPGRLLAFASEVTQLLALPDVPAQIHEAAVMGDLLATFGKPEWSFYAGIANVAPGHALNVDAEGSATKRYWSPDPAYRLDLRGEREYAEVVQQGFLESVAARLRTDRPAGILLSGGVDSGSVAAAAGWLKERNLVETPSIHAFSWAFERLTQCDERAVSRLIVDHYGLEETDIVADDAGPLAEFPSHGPHRDDPFLGAFQPLIERGLDSARSAGVTVMLGGDRGDLLFGPTGWSFLGLAEARRWHDLRAELAEYRRVSGESWPRTLNNQLIDPLKTRLRRPPGAWLRALKRRLARADPTSSRPEWLRPSAALRAAEAVAHEERAPAGFGFGRGLRHDAIFTQLHVRGMAWSERTYARHRLAFADPFSDRRLVEMALALPQAMVNRAGGEPKRLMRAAMRGVVPEPARLRLAKVLPTPLFEDGLRDQARGTVRELLRNPRVAACGWVDADAWRRHYELWVAGRAQLRAEWWWTLGVECWMRLYW